VGIYSLERDAAKSRRAPQLLVIFLNQITERRKNMQLSDEQVQALKQSIDELTNEMFNVDSRLKALCDKLAILSKAIVTSSAKKQ